MFESLSQRTVIIGNSGAGKSALAESLAASIHVPRRFSSRQDRRFSFRTRAL